MRIDATRLVKLGVFACLALTFYRGFMKLPEVFPVLNPEGFYRSQLNDGENSLIMKERHFDFNYQTGKALEIRREEMASRGDTPAPGALVNQERLDTAILKTQAKDVRNADALVMAEEKLARARQRQAIQWRLDFSCPPGAPGAAAQGGPR